MEGLAKNTTSCECDIWRKEEEEDVSECEREDTGWKKEMVSDILLISTSLLQWTRWDEMPLLQKSALHRYADVKNTLLWLFCRNSQMSTYASFTEESCCCEKKPFSHPGTLQRYQIKCCHIYTCLEGEGLLFFLFFLRLAEGTSRLKVSERRGGAGDPLTDHKPPVICFSSGMLPVETLVSVSNFEPPSCPCQAFLIRSPLPNVSGRARDAPTTLAQCASPCFVSHLHCKYGIIILFMRSGLWGSNLSWNTNQSPLSSCSQTHLQDEALASLLHR